MIDSESTINESEEVIAVEEENVSSEEVFIEINVEDSGIEQSSVLITPVLQSDIDISTPTFIGFGVSILIAFASLGVAVFLKIFKKA